MTATTFTVLCEDQHLEATAYTREEAIVVAERLRSLGWEPVIFEVETNESLVLDWEGEA